MPLPGPSGQSLLEPGLQAKKRHGKGGNRAVNTTIRRMEESKLKLVRAVIQ
jgi:hypothetical protein